MLLNGALITPQVSGKECQPGAVGKESLVEAIELI